MVPKIDFKDGIITYDNLFWLFNDTDGLINRNGKFKVYVVKNCDWQNPLFIKSDNTINDLITTIKQAINCIYAHEHIQQ